MRTNLLYFQVDEHVHQYYGNPTWLDIYTYTLVLQ